MFGPCKIQTRSPPSGFADTFAGSVRRVIVGNEPCRQEDPDSECRTEEQPCFQRRQVDTRWEGVEGVEEVARAHRLPVASVRRQGLRARLPRERVAARRPGVALHQPCVRPLPPSSSPSTLSGFP